MPIALIVAAFLSLFVAVGVRTYSHPAPKITPTPTMTVEATITPSPTEAMSGTPVPTAIKQSPTIKYGSTVTSTPTQKQNNTGATSTPTATPRPASTNTPTPIPADTSAPTFDWLYGPADGSTVTFNSFCFPMKYSDATGPIMVRYSFDSSSMGDWNKDYGPCYQSVSNGSHSFSVQAKDGLGNTTGTISRTFTVNVSAPTEQTTPTTTPEPTP